MRYGFIDLHGLMLLVVAAAWLMGIFLGSFVLLPPLVFLIGTGISLLLIVLLWHDRQGRLLMGIIFCLCLGAWRFAIAVPGNDPQALSPYIGASLVLRGTVSAEPKLSGHSRLLYITAHNMSRDGGNTWQEVHGQLTVQMRGTEIDDPYGANYGDDVKIAGKLLLPLPHSAPDVVANIFFPRITVTSVAGNSIITILSHWRIALSKSIEQTLPQPEAALLIAILLSIRTPALKPLIPAFNATGTAHLIAPSGFKVTILAGLVSSSMTWLSKSKIPQGKLLPAQKRGGWRRWLATSLVVTGIALYTLLSGAGPAAIRAGIMGILLVIAPRIGRTYTIYTALACTALLMSIASPFVIWDAGFQLSFLGTAGIVLLTPFFQYLLRPLQRLPCGHVIVEILAVTLAAQTATLPIMALDFQEVSFIAPLTNVLTVPLLGIMISLGVLIGGIGCISLFLARFCAWIAWPLLWYVDHIVAWCFALPGAYISVASLDSRIAWCYYALLTFIIIFVGQKWQPSHPSDHAPEPLFSRRTWHRLQLSLGLLTILATGLSMQIFKANTQVSITFLNVAPAGQTSQGEAILIRTPDDKTLLIDGGLDATALAQQLDRHLFPWQRSLDVVLLTTPRRDHLMGLLDSIQRYTIGEAIDGSMLHPDTTYALWRRTISERNIRYLMARQGMVVSIGSFVSLQVLWPAVPLHKGSDEVRDNGLILRITAPGLHLLLLGASAQSTYAQTGLLNNIDIHTLQADIVQIVGDAHTPFPTQLGEVLQRANPSLLVITPAARSAKLRSVSSVIDLSKSLVVKDARWQTMQTAQDGTLVISDSQPAWSVTTMGT